MRIVQFCKSFSRSSETFIYDTVTELNRRGVDCHVLTMGRINENQRPYDKVHVAKLPGRWNAHRLWHRALATLGVRGSVETHKWPAWRARARKHLERIDPDVVHAQFGPAGVLIGPVTEALDIPLAVTFHGYDISVLPNHEKIRNRYQKLFGQAEVLVGVSNHNASKLKALGAPEEKVETVHNGTRVDQFTYSNPVDRFDGHTVRVLHVGRLVEKKAPLELVEAFHHVEDRVDEEIELCLTIAGDGPLREKMVQRIEALGLGQKINYRGAVPHTEVRRLMGRAHVYTQHCKTASNGDEEGQGITFIEAQASGLPVVSTNHDGIPDVVLDGETGYLVPEGDTEAMADRIAHLAQHPEKWETMGRAGRRHVEEHFDLARQARDLLRIYGDLH
ncbi:glycosyltransferase [Salinibacter ruber]|uniref:glycosyltransferase n=1 Tax=Salinibacter ruber TaxID=146919 RepID=UPI000E56C4AF|nr:glycosyltransferase [Salinibacter ruber]